MPMSTPSGIHAHDLAEGSGSWDVPLGMNLRVGCERVYLSLHALYTIRTRGAHGYQFANDLVVNLAQGVDLWRSGAHRLGLEANLNGIAKGKDTVNGAPEPDSGMVELYLGPQITAVWTQLSGTAGVDAPLIQHDTGLQLVPDWRMHGGLVWAF